MKFHTWNHSVKDIYKNGGYYLPKIHSEVTLAVEALIRVMRQNNYDDSDIHSRAAYVAGSSHWELDRRPYYSIYPKVAASLIKVPLNTSVELLEYPTHSSTLLLRLAEGHELQGQVGSMLVLPMYDRKSDDHVICLVAQRTDINNTTIATYQCPTDASLESLFEGPVEVYEGGDTINPTIMRDCLRLALGVALLDNDPELIVPDVLNDDKAKLNSTIDPAVVAKLADKAHRRGKVGWIVGAATEEGEGREMSAHYRRAHMGFRWAGPKRSRLKWTHIKGAIIHRDKMTHVPTGYLDEEIHDQS